MKGLRSFIVMALVLSALQSCQNRQSQNYNNSLAVDSDGDTTPDTARKLHMLIDNEDTQFAIAAINGGAAEVIMGRLAVQAGKSKEVKNFGAMMVKDHNKANEKLLKLIKEKNIKLPEQPGAKEMATMTMLSKKSGADFDRAYVRAMIEAHQEDVKEFTAASKKLQDPELKDFAIKTLPLIQNHLDKINAIRDGMK